MLFSSGGKVMREIRKVGVLGAGTMGSQIAAHLANAQIPCVLLDRAAPALAEEAGLPKGSQSRSRLAEAGLAGALKARPAAFFVPEFASLVTTGNFDDHLPCLRDCDWVVEAVSENLEVKRELLSKAAPHLSPGAMASSNTSGISLAAISNGFSREFRQHWLGTHFFNPPRYMKLLEIIPTPQTLPDVIERASSFGEGVLGKGIVRAKDTPNFIANRIGVYVHLVILQIMQEEGFSIEEIDVLAGPAMGLPKSAMFRTVDIVGLDVMAHVVKNLYASLPEDPERGAFHVPEFMTRMIERNLLGEKTKSGFYRRVPSKTGEGAEILTLDLETMEYRPRQIARFDSMDLAKGTGDVRERVRALFHASDRAGRFYQMLFDRIFRYTAGRIPEISDDIVSVDRAMRWGFNWQYGVFELWDSIGV
ncbi:MAG: 3-hydroxyacyl-CoA dehydrogenase family protein, partial [Acidobacteriota bacterium]|nr:3-hydroxyacyl-CoA dehydrogenase family protein [Acidobacteriota bacterium]